MRQAGVDDQPIPKEWDGAQLSIHVGSAITASWEEGIALFQHPPLALSAPAGFDFTTYWTAALRAAGVNREQAQKLAGRLTTTPTLLLGIDRENRVAIREVNLHSGSATLIENIDKMGKVKHVTLIWSVADRVYHLSGASEELVMRAANSIE